jgi:hypothetical protein
MKKKILSLMILSLFFVPSLLVANNVSAGNSDDVFGLGYVTGDATQDVNDGIVLGNKDPRTMITQIINVLLTLLGIVAVGIVLLGGFKWMTAGGNEDKVGEAKKILGAGIIGLVIILAAWGIAAFVLNTLMDATGN